MRFLHTSDWQLGMKAVHVGRAAEKVRSARIETIRRMQQIAREADVDFAVIAGDTFEDHGVSRKLVVGSTVLGLRVASGMVLFYFSLPLMTKITPRSTSI